ncbi:hypothetical protein [Hoeflea prorocentri]|uniref:Transporter n=1 Tax=Hoeflea prorocentri TaxID=1922333 RepID=A0A9X3UFI0_9HYPH|nr:hypothetical protein [Hoeflea prorocentri]MCY6379945.1 hypothetical protein [Hoeflea prorocentri]MDA5397745.1 hypothetical protein [Hoeflea prorocentri]
MPLLLGLMFALATALIDLAGDVVIKSAADKARFVSFATMVGIILYGLTAVCWYFTMRHVGLGQGTVFYSMLSLIAAVLIGVLWFGDGLGIRQVAGVGCAVAAMALMSETA